MTDVLAHRDPDDEGYYINSSNAGKRNSKWKFGKGGGVDSSVLGSPDVNPWQNLSIKRK